MLHQEVMEAEAVVEKVAAVADVRLKSTGGIFVMTAVDPEEEEEHLEVKEGKVDLAVPAVVVRLVFIVSIQILEL